MPGMVGKRTLECTPRKQLSYTPLLVPYATRMQRQLRVRARSFELKTVHVADAAHARVTVNIRNIRALGGSINLRIG